MQVAGVAATASSLLAACAAPAPAAAPAAAPPAAGNTAAGSATAAPVAASPGGLKDVPRNRTFIAVRGGSQGKFIEWDQWNPFVPVANHQFAVGLMYEPLAF